MESPSILKIEYAQIEPTTRCNFTCSFCCGRNMEQQDISFEMFSKVLDTFPAIVEPNRSLDLDGGIDSQLLMRMEAYLPHYSKELLNDLVTPALAARFETLRNADDQLLPKPPRIGFYEELLR